MLFSFFLRSCKFYAMTQALWQKLHGSKEILVQKVSAQKHCFGSGSGLDPDSIRSLDPDSESGSGSRGKKVRKKFFFNILKKCTNLNILKNV